MTDNSVRSNIFLSRVIVKAIPYCLLFFCLLPLIFFAWKKPAYNWDILPYMAIVIEKVHPEFSEKQVHDFVYEEAKQKIPSSEYRLLVDSDASNRHRKEMYENFNAFSQQLSFYRVKPLYTGLVYFFYKTGFSLPRSTIIPSIISFLGLAFLLFNWIKKYLNLVLTLIVTLLIMYSSFMIGVSRQSTPDCLSAFLLLAGIYFVIEKPRRWIMFSCFALAIFARIDNVVTCSIIIFLLIYLSKQKREKLFGQYLIMLLLFSVSYFIITMVFESQEWRGLFYPKFIHYYNQSYEFKENFSWNSYFSLLYSKAITGLISSQFVFFLFLGSLLFIDKLSQKPFKITSDQLFVFLFISITIVRFFLFPELSDRFNIAFYLVILILLIKKFQGVKLEAQYFSK